MKSAFTKSSASIFKRASTLASTWFVAGVLSILAATLAACSGGGGGGGG